MTRAFHALALLLVLALVAAACNGDSGDGDASDGAPAEDAAVDDATGGEAEGESGEQDAPEGGETVPAEAEDDCFREEPGRDAECIIDVVEFTVERVPPGATADDAAAVGSGGGLVPVMGRATGTACEGLRATFVTAGDLEQLGSGPEVLFTMAVRPAGTPGSGNSKDTNVSLRYRDGVWQEPEAFGGPGGPGDRPAEGTYSGGVEGRNAVLQLDAHGDESCITDDDGMRLQVSAAEEGFGGPGSSNEATYDVVGVEGRFDVKPVSAYVG